MKPLLFSHYSQIRSLLQNSMEKHGNIEILQNGLIIGVRHLSMTDLH